MNTKAKGDSAKERDKRLKALAEARKRRERQRTLARRKKKK
jgi:hypothetical protein